MAGSNYVAYNLAQARSDSEKAQARNNIGAAALASLAASFESRAPSYNWSKNGVCIYDGKLWMFDNDHSGPWTGTDAHEVTIQDVFDSVPKIYENVLDYADDWVDISNDFEPASGATIYRERLVVGNVSDLHALISRSKKLLYFNSDTVRIVRNNIDFSNWNYLLKYKGNEIKFTKDGGKNPLINYFVYPKNVSRGMELFYMVGSDGGSTNDFCMTSWVGSNNTNTYLSLKAIVNNNTGGKGCVIGQYCFDIELF